MEIKQIQKMIVNQQKTVQRSLDVCTEIENNDIETVENNENNQKSLENKNKDNDKFHVNFDMLSTVSEENLTNSDRNSVIHMEHVPLPPPMKSFDNLSYTQAFTAVPTVPFGSDVRWVDNKLLNESILKTPNSPKSPGHFFAPIMPKFNLETDDSCPGTSTSSYNNSYPSTFQMGGNLEELLSDIENLSHDIHELQIKNKRYHSEEQINYQPDILTTSVSLASVTQANQIETKKPFRSELSLVLSTPGMKPTTNIKSQLSNLEPIGFEPFNDVKTTKKISTMNNNNNNNSDKAKVRRQFLKGPSMSLNELVNSKYDTQHSKAIIQKRRSLDEIIPRPTINNLNDKVAGKLPEKSPKTKHKSRHVPLLFRKKTDDIFNNPETIINNDKIQSDNFHTKELSTNIFTKHKNSNKHKKQIPIETIQTKLQRNGTEIKFNKKYSRLSIDSATGNFYESQDSTVDQRTSYSEKNSFDSSRESSASFSTRRKVSLTSHHNNEKIPWCGCWGNGCF